MKTKGRDQEAARCCKMSRTRRVAQPKNGLLRAHTKGVAGGREEEGAWPLGWAIGVREGRMLRGLQMDDAKSHN